MGPRGKRWRPWPADGIRPRYFDKIIHSGYALLVCIIRVQFLFREWMDDYSFLPESGRRGMEISSPQRGQIFSIFIKALAIIFPFALIFHPFISAVPAWRDTFMYFAPAKSLLFEELRKGSPPLWNPWHFFGSPAFSDFQVGWFYPPNLLALFFSFPAAFKILVLIHYPIAFFSTYLFLRGRGLDRPSCYWGGMIFCLCGHMTHVSGYLTMLVGLGLAPLALFFADRALKPLPMGPAIRARNAFCSGAVIALQVLGGDPQNALVTSLMVFCMGLFRFSFKPRFRPAPFMVAIIGIAAALMSLVQTLPTLEFFNISERGRGLTAAESGVFSFHPARLIELVWPNPFMTDDYFYWAKNLLDWRDGQSLLPYALSNYLGLSAIGLALFGLARGRRRSRALIGMAAAFCLAVSWGRHFPLYGLLRALVPFSDLFRFPEKAMGWFSFFIAVLAAFGFHELRKALYAPSRSASAIAAGLLGFSLVAAVAGTALLRFFLLGLSQKGLVSPNEIEPYIYLGGLKLFLVACAFLVPIILCARRRLKPSRATAIIIAVIILDLWSANARLMVRVPDDVFESRSPVAEAIIKDGGPSMGNYRVARVASDFPSRQADESPSYLIRRTIWHRSVLGDNFSSFDRLESCLGYNPLRPQDETDHGELLSDPHYLRLYNARYLIHPYLDSPANNIGETIYNDKPLNVGVTRIRDAFARSYFVPRAIFASGDREALSMMAKADFTREVVLTAERPISMPAMESNKPPVLKTLAYGADDIVLETSSDSYSWLVLSNRFHPGWRCTVDGEKVSIYPANLMVMAVQAPPGKHRIEFRFVSRTFSICAAVSIMAWLAFIVWLGAGLMRNGRGLSKKRT